MPENDLSDEARTGRTDLDPEFARAIEPKGVRDTARPDGARDHATQQQGDGDAVVLSSGEDAGTI